MKLNILKAAPLFLGMLVAAPFAGHSAALVTYDFTGLTDLPATASTNLLSATTLTEGAGSTFDVANNNGQDAMHFIYSSASNDDQASAVGANAYVEFTINPASSYTMETITWTQWADTSSGTRLFTWFVRTNAGGDNYTTTLDSQTQASVNFASLVNLDLDVSALGTVSGPVTFRLYTYDNSGSGGHVYLDNVTLNGVPVPEPGSASFLALSAGALIIFRRRR